ncbi:MAG: hypothetical protein ABIB47_00450 [Candidatus Woesearchaeota archaeon]
MLPPLDNHQKELKEIYSDWKLLDYEEYEDYEEEDRTNKLAFLMAKK